MRAEFGHCLICDKETATTCGACSHKRPNADYTQVEVQWSNGSKMPIGVCTTCAASGAWSTPEAKQAITQAHWDIWEKTGGHYDKEVVIA